MEEYRLNTEKTSKYICLVKQSIKGSIILVSKQCIVILEKINNLKFGRYFTRLQSLLLACKPTWAECVSSSCYIILNIFLCNIIQYIYTFAHKIYIYSMTCLFSMFVQEYSGVGVIFVCICQNSYCFLQTVHTITPDYDILF